MKHRLAAVSDPTPKERLLSSGIRLASITNIESISLIDAALDANLSAELASSFYYNDADFYRGIYNYIRSRFEYYTSYNKIKSSAEQLKELTEGYFAFSQYEPHNFVTFTKLIPPNGEEHPIFELFRSINPLSDPQDCPPNVMMFMAGVHGVTHFSTLGVTRLLLPAAKQSLLNMVVSNMSIALNAPKVDSFEPKLPKKISTKPGIARFMPRETLQDRKTAVFRAAVEVVSHQGIEHMTSTNCARQAGLRSADGNLLFDGDEAFTRQLEFYLDTQAEEAMGMQVEVQQPLPNTASVLKAMCFGLVDHATADPYGYDLAIKVASGSIVPATFGGDSDIHEMSDAFQLVVKMVSQCIAEFGGEPDSWSVFEQTITLASIAHGIAQLLSVGFLRKSDRQIQDEMISRLVDCAIVGMKLRFQS